MSLAAATVVERKKTPRQLEAEIEKAIASGEGHAPFTSRSFSGSDDQLDGRPARERDKVLGRMKEWARTGNWNNRVGFIKQVALPDKFSDVALYEVKSHQDRILFVRCHNDAVAIDAMQKKNDWSKKEDKVLEAAALIARRAMKECGARR